MIFNKWAIRKNSNKKYVATFMELPSDRVGKKYQPHPDLGLLYFSNKIDKKKALKKLINLLVKNKKARIKKLEKEIRGLKKCYKNFK